MRLFRVLFLGLWSLNIYALTQVLPASTHNCVVSLFKIRVEELTSSQPSDKAEIKKLLKTISESPDLFAKEFLQDPDLELSLEELLYQSRSPELHREAAKILRTLPNNPTHELVKWLDVSILPKSASEAINQEFLQPFARLPSEQRKRLQDLLSGVSDNEGLTRRMRQITALHSELLPEQKKLLATNLAAQFNSKGKNLKFGFLKELPASAKGDYFLCSDNCNYIMIFAADKKVYCARNKSDIAPVTPDNWRNEVKELFEATP